MTFPRVDIESNFDFNGLWWEPVKDSEPEKVHGHLSYKPDSGLRLSAVDWHRQPFVAKPVSQLPVILGETLFGKPCTLFDALSSDHTAYSPAGHSEEEWKADLLLFGAHVEDLDQFQVQRARVSISGLREWLCWPWTGPTQGGGSVNRLGPDRDSIEVDLASGKVTLGLGHTRRPRQFVHHEELTASALFEFDAPQTLDEFKESYARPLQDLLLFALREETRLNQLTLYFPGKPLELWWKRKGPPPGPRWDEVEVVEQQSLDRPSTHERSLGRMLFPLGAWSEEAPTLARRWFELRQQLGGVGNVLFSTLNDRRIHLENRFLNLMTVAEAYHRVLHNRPLVEEARHQEAVGTMLGALSEGELREIYRPRLRHADEQTQKMRLRELFERAEPVLDKVKAWRQQLTRRLVDTRNYLTHWGEKQDSVLEGHDLWIAMGRLLIVIEINLMLDLGMQTPLIERAVRQGYATNPILHE